MSRTIEPINRAIYDGRRLLGRVVTDGDGFTAFDADDNAVARFNTEPAAVQAVLDLRETAVSGDHPDAIAAYCEEAGSPSSEVIRWWMDQGVTIDALTKPLAVLAARVVFQPNGTYGPNILGEFAHVFPAFDSDGLADVVAWSPKSGRIASRLGIASMLGEEQVARASGASKPLLVWHDPVGWLRAGRRGVVILEPEVAAARLASLPAVAEDDAHARHLRSVLKVPPPRIGTMSIPISRAAA
jgi:hypothetical protein